MTKKNYMYTQQIENEQWNRRFVATNLVFGQINGYYVISKQLNKSQFFTKSRDKLNEYVWFVIFEKIFPIVVSLQFF